MRRADLPPHKTATYVLPRWKLVYVSVPKAACTSLKWLLADVHGESRQRFYATLSTETGRSMTVHRRSRWQHTPMLHELSDAQLDEISPDNGWLVFAVVRHPSTRLWSGWQSKLLLREPRFATLYPEAPWPRIPQTTSDVVTDFHRFVRVLADDPEQPVLRDRHFLAQTALLRIDRTPYSRIYQTSQIPQLLDDLEKHLLPQGLEAMPALQRSNETPLQPVAEIFDAEVAQIIGRYYADDFERFDYDDPVPEPSATAQQYTSAALAEVARLVERAERIGDLAEIASTARAKQRELAREMAVLRRRVGELDQRSVVPATGRGLLRGVRRRTSAALHALRQRVDGARSRPNGHR